MNENAIGTFLHGDSSSGDRGYFVRITDIFSKKASHVSFIRSVIRQYLLGIFYVERKSEIQSHRSNLAMLSDSLKSIRQFNRLSQTEVATRLGVSKSQISEVESGRRSPSETLLNKYAEAFDVPVSSIYFLSEQLDGREHINPISQKVLRIIDWIRDDEPEKPSALRGIDKKDGVHA